MRYSRKLMLLVFGSGLGRLAAATGYAPATSPGAVMAATVVALVALLLLGAIGRYFELE